MASTSDEREDTLNVDAGLASYNSKGFTDNRVEIIKEMLAYNNIVFIQEHWQCEEQLHKLNIDNRHIYILRHSSTLVIGVCVNSPTSLMQSCKAARCQTIGERAPSHLSIKTRETT